MLAMLLITEADQQISVADRELEGANRATLKRDCCREKSQAQPGQENTVERAAKYRPASKRPALVVRVQRKGSPSKGATNQSWKRMIKPSIGWGETLMNLAVMRIATFKAPMMILKAADIETKKESAPVIAKEMTGKRNDENVGGLLTAKAFFALEDIIRRAQSQTGGATQGGPLQVTHGVARTCTTIMDEIGTVKRGNSPGPLVVPEKTRGLSKERKWAHAFRPHLGRIQEGGGSGALEKVMAVARSQWREHRLGVASKAAVLNAKNSITAIACYRHGC